MLQLLQWPRRDCFFGVLYVALFSTVRITQESRLQLAGLPVLIRCVKTAKGDGRSVQVAFNDSPSKILQLDLGAHAASTDWSERGEHRS